MRWPWQSAPVEHRSSYTDQVVTAILQSASGSTGVRPALATAALETVATLYASALSACAVSGPSTITRALTAEWRAAVASALVRNGQALYIVGADPSAGLALTPVSHWDVHGGPERASWFYRCELAGHPRPPGARGARARCCISAGWWTMPGRGRVSRQCSTRPIRAVWPDGSTSDSVKRRAGRSERFCLSRALTSTPTPTWPTPTPTIHSPCCGGISAARRAKRSSSRPRWPERILPLPRHARIFRSHDSARIRPRSCGVAPAGRTGRCGGVRRAKVATRFHGERPSVARRLAAVCRNIG